MGGTGRRNNRQGGGTGLHPEGPASAVSRLLLQSIEGTRSRCTNGADGFCDQRRDAWWLRFGRGAGRVSCPRGRNFHRWSQRDCLRKRSRSRHLENRSEERRVGKEWEM